jgi:adenylate kinase family enzyme
MRVNVVGSAGSGKSTLAGRLATILNCQHVEMDALYWEDEWAPAEPEIFCNRVGAAVSSDCWVADGNYSLVRDIVWARVQMVVWLDYPLALNLWRLTRRSLSRAVTREALWNTNNRESFLRMFSHDSLYIWTVQTHARRRRLYRTLAAAPEHDHIQFVRLTSPRAAEQWLCEFMAARDANRGF